MSALHNYLKLAIIPARHAATASTAATAGMADFAVMAW